MSFVCSDDSCENCITRGSSCKMPRQITFFRVSWARFQSNALEFSMCQTRGQTCGNQLGHEFCMFSFMWKLHNKRKSESLQNAQAARQITFFRVSWVPKQCSGIFNVSNAWTNMWNKLMEKRQGSRGRTPRKDLKRMSMPAVWTLLREFSWFQIPLPNWI